ncbi:uncharacterized protein LOC130690368 isoform X2 [Daphnia carinata]|uniref:uncharacterized protein LOC130690368 isoform X2 n=1 Tax=Daphnia carinata TaxID=120202 RepID=UPI002869428A|nr:uncharacterized protein LOC130690368 isoform X2 [Daphnia carinata]
MIRREPQLKQQFIKRPLETRVVSLVSVHPTVARTNNDDIAAGNKFCTKLFFAQYDARKADFRRRNPTSSSIAICKILKCQLLSNKIKSLFLKTFTTKRKLYFFQENAPTIELPSLGENKPVKCNGSHRSRDAKLPKRLLLYSVGASKLIQKFSNNLTPRGDQFAHETAIFFPRESVVGGCNSIRICGGVISRKQGPSPTWCNSIYKVTCTNSV